MIERVIEAGIAATAAESVGAMEALHAMTLEYSRTREQFGKPIGTNQVVQHRSGGDADVAGAGPLAWRCWRR